MLQKIIWMRCLLIGTSLSFMLLFQSCKEEADCLVIGEFVYKNTTSFSIETPKGTIQPNKSMMIKEEGLGSCEVSKESYISPFHGGVTVIFDNQKCLSYEGGLKANEGEGPVGIANYNSSKVADRHFKFEYTFSDSDYEKAQAEPCN